MTYKLLSVAALFLVALAMWFVIITLALALLP